MEINRRKFLSATIFGVGAGVFVGGRVLIYPVNPQHVYLSAPNESKTITLTIRSNDSHVVSVIKPKTDADNLEP